MVLVRKEFGAEGDALLSQTSLYIERRTYSCKQRSSDKSKKADSNSSGDDIGYPIRISSLNESVAVTYNQKTSCKPIATTQ